jgi:hypothetical protein
MAQRGQGAEDGGVVTARWAGTLVTSSHVIKPEACLGPPDGVRANFIGAPPVTATVSGFAADEASLLSLDGLAALLTVDKSVLERMDFMAFEHNNYPGNMQHFESGNWTFSDGAASLTLCFDHFNPRSSPFILAVRAIDTRRYCAFFGFPDPFKGGDLQCLLFDLRGLNPSSPNFTVTLEATGRSHFGSPDPDAMAILDSQALVRCKPGGGDGEVGPLLAASPPAPQTGPDPPGNKAPHEGPYPLP